MSTNQTEQESRVDVLIIGAGPAGLMCANGLAKAGVNVRIVDKRPIKVAAGQADGIQPRTIEVLQSYGLAERLLREGNQMHMAAFYNPGPDGGIVRTGKAPDVTAPSARFPHEVTLHQGAIEAIFLDSMATMGVKVERPIVPTSIELSSNEAELKDPQAHAVKVVLKHLDPAEGQSETEIVRAKFVLGADGAHSWVRRTLGISMDGEQTNYIWGVVDIIPKTNFPDVRCKTAVHSNNGSCMIIPREGDIIRLYIQLSEKDIVVDPQTGRLDKDKTKLGPKELMAVAKKSFHPFEIEPESFDWWTIYIIGQRVASRFSVNERVFIAGDACHTHSPKAGQGMNASMNDTHNLIWKLSHVLRGWAPLSLLQTYEFERRKYAQDLIAFDKKFAALFSGKPRTEENQDGVGHDEFIEAFQTFGLFTSGIGIHYQPSQLIAASNEVTSQSARKALVPGQRMPPHIFLRSADARPYELQDLLPADTRFKVLVFAGDTTNSEQIKHIESLAREFEKEDGWYKRYGQEKLDVLVISSAKKEEVNWTDIPKVLMSHWSKVLVDDRSAYDREGSGGYEAYGIDPLRGAIVVVRPDQYVGLVVSLEKAMSGEVGKYLDNIWGV